MKDMANNGESKKGGRGYRKRRKRRRRKLARKAGKSKRATGPEIRQAERQNGWGPGGQQKSGRQRPEALRWPRGN